MGFSPSIANLDGLKPILQNVRVILSLCLKRGGNNAISHGSRLDLVCLIRRRQRGCRGGGARHAGRLRNVWAASTGSAAATASRFLRRRDSGWTGRGIHWPRAAGGHDVSRIPLALPQRRRTLSNLPAQRLGGDPRPTVDPCIFTAFRQFACSRGGRRGTGLRSSPGVRSMAAATARGGPIACPPQGVPRTGRTIADL